MAEDDSQLDDIRLGAVGIDRGTALQQVSCGLKGVENYEPLAESLEGHDIT